MTRYADKSFSVPVSPGVRVCPPEGHAFADRKGKCVRCGAVIRSSGWEDAEFAHRPQHDLDERKRLGRA